MAAWERLSDLVDVEGSWMQARVTGWRRRVVPGVVWADGGGEEDILRKNEGRGSCAQDIVWVGWRLRDVRRRNVLNVVVVEALMVGLKERGCGCGDAGLTLTARPAV